MNAVAKLVGPERTARNATGTLAASTEPAIDLGSVFVKRAGEACFAMKVRITLFEYLKMIRNWKKDDAIESTYAYQVV